MPNRPHRQSIRIPGYDYTRPGSYFITVCQSDRKNVFGRIEDQAVVLTPLGEIVREHLQLLPFRRKGIAIDCQVVMPNHIHFMLQLIANVDGRHRAQTGARFQKVAEGSVPVIVGGFKSGVTREARQKSLCAGFGWQRGYYEHVVRDEEGFFRIRRYIAENPSRWQLDRENSDRTGVDEFDEWMDSMTEERFQV